jgi:hypothetical protein
MHFHFQRNNPYSIFTKNCHPMNIKKNQTSLCSIKILHTFTNKLLYQTLNIYKTIYLHFFPLTIVKIFKIYKRMEVERYLEIQLLKLADTIFGKATQCDTLPLFYLFHSILVTNYIWHASKYYSSQNMKMKAFKYDYY